MKSHSNKEESFERFLLNEDLKNYLHIDENSSYYSSFYYKESFNHRFDLIYEKKYYENQMKNENYEFAGYYDRLNKVIYEPSYIIGTMQKSFNVIQFNTLSYLSDKIDEDTKDYLKKYCIDNIESLKKNNKDAFDKQDQYTFNAYNRKVERKFVSDNNLSSFTLAIYSMTHKVASEFKFFDNLIYTEYLDNPQKTISRICDKLLQSDEVKKDLGFLLLENEWMNNYLKEINENKNHKFDNLYLNKKILNSIKDVEAQNFNITIEYNNEHLTFKFPKNRLVNDLEECRSNSCNWGKAYEIVEKFLEDYKTGEKWCQHDFDFANITSITYGKNILYENNAEKVKDETEMEMI